MVQRNSGLLCGAAAVYAASGMAFAAPTYSIVALSGVSNQYGPGMGAGVTFTPSAGSGFNTSPSISDGGQVAFSGNATNAGTPQGMWIHAAGLNTNVASAGGPMPGGGTYTTGTSGVINAPSVNDTGQWFFRLGGTTGLFGTASGVPTRAALSAQTALGTGGATYASVATGTPFTNDAGQMGYLAVLTTGSGSPAVVTTAGIANNNAIFVGTPGAATSVLRQNDTLTTLDASGNTRVGPFQNLSMSFNGSGEYVISNTLQGSNVVTGTTGNNGAILTNRNGSIEVIARVGAPAPDANGVASSDLFRLSGTGGITASAIGFNDAGNVAFVSGLRNAAGTQTATAALFTDTIGGTLRLIGRNGGTAPTIYNPNGTVNSSLTGLAWSSFSNVVLNGQGTTAFNGSLSSSAVNALITMDTSGRMTSLARTGDVAIIGGQPLGGDAHFNTFSNIMMNAAGQMVFQSLLVNEGGIIGGTGSAGGSNSCIFAWDQNAGLQLVARVGDLFTVAPGDVRTINTIAMTSSGGQDGRVSQLNNSGQFAFTLTFVDGSNGVFIATIPTPGAAGLLAAAGVVAGRRRR